MPKTTLQTIWQFHLMVIDKQTVMMPEGSIVLCVQMQGGNPCLWALVDPAAAVRERTFRIIATGDEIKDNPGNYVATFQMLGGSFVFHVFEGF